MARRKWHWYCYTHGMGLGDFETQRKAFDDSRVHVDTYDQFEHQLHPKAGECKPDEILISSSRTATTA